MSQDAVGIFRGWKPKDVIALLSLAICFFLIYHGIDTVVGVVVASIIAYYYGHQRAENGLMKPGGGTNG